ncbi:MAG: ribonuclease J [Deltaproteobacteria bacterium]|nr:ribonuclease J [Deltaproteobacteria bacterium]
MPVGSLVADAHELAILPLGGCGEIGLNATLFVYGDKALLVDFGVMLGLEDMPGIDRALPTFAPLDRVDLCGVVLTHGHEDHIGAVPHLLDSRSVPVYGTKLALALLEARLEEHQPRGRKLIPVGFGERFEVGPFAIELVSVTHSIPEAAALIIEVAGRRIVHSGDFKLDERPHDGRLTDVARLRAAGDAGVDLLLSDSTNAERSGHTRSETEVGLEIRSIVGESDGRVMVTCFASHLHRVDAIGHAAQRAGRGLVLLGRSLHRTVSLGLREHHLTFDPGILIEERRLKSLDPRRVVVLVTGSQGEPRAALSSIAYGRDRGIELGAGDKLVVSATVIPGNEKRVRRIENTMRRKGVEVIHDRMRPVHCSGHAHSGEQAEFLRILRPRHFIPIHGDRLMLEAHAATARGVGVEPDRVIVLENGQGAVFEGDRLVRGRPRVPAPIQPIDASSGRVISSDAVFQRRRIAERGVLMCSLTISNRKLLGRPRVSGVGVVWTAGLAGDLEQVVSAFVSSLDERGWLSISSAVEREVARAFAQRTQARPEVLVQVNDLDAPISSGSEAWLDGQTS